jgi:hypothetical protein
MKNIQLTLKKTGQFTLLIYIFISLSIGFSSNLYSATYKGEKIDGRHYAAMVWIKGEKTKYRVDVVFVETKANLVFAPNQTLRVPQQINNYLTLYLLSEEIKDPKEIILRELIPPTDMTGKNKDTKYWKLKDFWVMDVNLN